MASVLDKVKVKSGRLIRVVNESRPKFSHSNLQYVSVWVEDSDGKNERCLLFTQNEIKIAEDRANRNKEDLTDKNFLTDLLD